MSRTSRQKMDVETVTRRIRQDFPCLTIGRLMPLGEGLGNVAFEVDDAYVFRFPKADVNIVDLQRELLILPVVRTRSTLPVPQPDFVPPDRSYVGYPKVPGRILMNAAEGIPASGCTAMGRQLGAFLSSIHEIPAAAFDSSAVKHESLSPEDCLASARNDYAEVRGWIPTRYVAAVERFLDASPAADAWSGDPVFSHNDLGSEHILVQDGVLSASSIGVTRRSPIPPTISAFCIAILGRRFWKRHSRATPGSNQPKRISYDGVPIFTGDGECSRTSRTGWSHSTLRTLTRRCAR